MVVAAVFGGIVMAGGFLLEIRNHRVYCERTREVRRVHAAAVADIEAGRPWEWRYDAFRDGPSYDAMMWRIWRPVRSFYAGHPPCESVG